MISDQTSNIIEFFKQTKFTIGKLVQLVLGVDNPADALILYQHYVKWLEGHQLEIGYLADPSKTIAENIPLIAKSNIGWCFGEGMSEDRVQMWVQATGASHPIFGRTIEYSQEQIFKMGYDYAKKHGKENERLVESTEDK